jgi:hypothetical protein
LDDLHEHAIKCWIVKRILHIFFYYKKLVFGF